MDKKDGTRVRREYALLGQNIRFAGEQPCEQRAAPVTPQAPTPLSVAQAPAPAKESWIERIKRKLKLK